MLTFRSYSCFFFFNDTATTEIYTLSLHDTLPIYASADFKTFVLDPEVGYRIAADLEKGRFIDVLGGVRRSEEHTSELQSRLHLVCRLLLEKKKIFIPTINLAYVERDKETLHPVVI